MPARMYSKLCVAEDLLMSLQGLDLFVVRFMKLILRQDHAFGMILGFGWTASKNITRRCRWVLESKQSPIVEARYCEHGSGKNCIEFEARH